MNTFLKESQNDSSNVIPFKDVCCKAWKFHTVAYLDGGD